MPRLAPNRTTFGAKTLKVLILSASTGNGHMSAAFAIEEELKSRGHKVKVVDVLDHTGRGFRAWYRGGYEILVKKNPAVWGHLYKSSDRKLFNYHVQTALDSIFVSKMRRFFMKEGPDWVLCTHSLPQPSLRKWRKRLNFKVGIVVTDLYPQRMWLRGAPDWFFVPGDWSQRILEKRLPQSEGKITVTGIPINRQFVSSQDSNDCRNKLGLVESKPVVLVTSGGIGGGPIGDVVEALGKLTDIQFVVVCGRSKEAFAVATSAADGAKHITVHGQVDSSMMAQLMHAANLIVAKPGGITTFESLAVGLPFLVYDPFLIPGQEEKNAEFLVESGIGRRANNPAQLVQIVTELLQNEELLASMKQQAHVHSKPDAARDICDVIESQAQN